MLLIHTFFKKAREVLFGTSATKGALRKGTRTLRIEELEPREMLSVTPVDWDWWETAQVTDTIPTYYNIDPGSEDFGVISIGGNDSQIDATTAFNPLITGNFLAFDTVTRQGNVTELDDNNVPTVVGSYTETITVGIFSQDLGNGDWFYQEQVGYTYSYTAESGNYLYDDGYSYNLTASFFNGIYESTFTLTTGYGFSDGISIDDSAFCWEVSVEYSITNTATITHSHNTLTSERSGTDTRTTYENSSYNESGSFSYNTSDYTVSETFTLTETSITDLFSTVSLADAGNEWVIDSGNGHDYYYDFYNYNGTYSETFSEEGLSYAMHDNSWSNSLSEANVDYLWSNGVWQITGDATTTDGFGYDWGETLSAPMLPVRFPFPRVLPTMNPLPQNGVTTALSAIGKQTPSTAKAVERITTITDGTLPPPTSGHFTTAPLLEQTMPILPINVMKIGTFHSAFSIVRSSAKPKAVTPRPTNPAPPSPAAARTAKARPPLRPARITLTTKHIMVL